MATILSLAEARRRWLHAQRLDVASPFGAGPAAVQAAVEQLGYVQIDTIHVIERAHHHILWSRIPDYRREDLTRALSIDRTVFEVWTHALAYAPVRDYRFFMAAMQRHRDTPDRWFGSVSPAELNRLVRRIRRDGPISIRDIDGDRVDKDHPWASRKPEKRALELGFFTGILAVAARQGMIKTYDLAERHFGWSQRPRAASEAQIVDYLLDRALRAQAVVSLDSICHLDAGRKKAVAAAIEARVRRRRLLPVTLEGSAGPHWMVPGEPPPADEPLTHILSPFDPLVIQRRRLKAFFDHDHIFEAYLPKEKRMLGYFGLPVLVGDRVAATLDVKADRAARRLLLRQWTWAAPPRAGDRLRIEEALHRFAAFQFDAARTVTGPEPALPREG